MISLYSRLARQWDLLFPPDDARVGFLAGLLKQMGSGSRIIEVGCGTGATAISLAALGHSVSASDLDSEMIAIAEQSAAGNDYPETGSVSFSVDDMLGTLEAAPPGSADLILCLGNTLPHLTEPDELSRFFHAAAPALAAEGKLVIQILNYPRIVGLGGLNLPELQGDDLIFRRKQSFVPETGLISFHTEVESGREIESRSHNLLPLSIGQLVELSIESGLKDPEIFGDWDKKPFHRECTWLAAVCTVSGASD